MFNAKRRSNGVIVLLITLFVLIVIGCGGGGGGGGGSASGGSASAGATGSSATAGGTTAGAQPGTLIYTLQWPVETRGIPPYALSVVVNVYRSGTTALVAHQTLTRSKSTSFDQNVSFSLPAGNYRVVAEAHLNGNGAGDVVASATLNVTVTSGQSSTTVLDLTSTISKLFVDDLSAQGTVGDQIQLSAHAQDTDGNALLLPTGALVWSITDGDDKALVTPDGALTLLAPGSVTVQVRDIDTDITATKTLTLVQGPTNGIIIIVS